ncbi:hypothetical protein [Pseudoxanthomonas mexicana]|uniref:hypothetical protein n=1 Tax=Pseudoxanthomonas mexicana TaxID=128785 RepID=UPI00289DDF8A|nr:hypothetical protein [Pseudoxanthomonas mexicana]
MDMTRDSTLDEVCALIALMPDAKVVGQEWSGDHARIVVHVAGDALEALTHAASTANVQMEQHTCELGHHVITASAVPRDTLDHGELQLLGIHLVWHLLEAGVLPQDAGERLLSVWKAESP